MYEYRIYPSDTKEKTILNIFKICKEVYNEILGLNKKLMLTKKFDMNSIITDIKITDKKYFSQVHSQVLQNIADRLSKAFDNFFRRVSERNNGKKIKVGFPRFKSQITSITYPQSGFKFISGNKIHISKIGSVPIVLHRIPKGKIKTMTIKCRANKWFAVFSCEAESATAIHPSSEKAGIDVGLKEFAVLSDGNSIVNQRFFVKSQRKLRMLQRRLSRKLKGSRNRVKAKLKVARCHLRIADQRRDFLHKISRKIANKYSFIGVESLNIANMLKNHDLAKHISDASWGNFIKMLSYKAVTCGGQVVKSPRTKGSSHRCSKCGFYVEDIPLSKRKFVCPQCKLSLHRDLNASINHLNDTVGLTGI
jgi:putative transposase